MPAGASRPTRWLFARMSTGVFKALPCDNFDPFACGVILFCVAKSPGISLYSVVSVPFLKSLDDIVDEIKAPRVTEPLG